MAQNPDLDTLLQALAGSPKQDNSSYLEAMAEARRVYRAAEQALGGPVTLTSKAKLRKDGRYQVKWRFTRKH